ncbi:recombinase family protein, partial [Amycolatopsis lurida]
MEEAAAKLRRFQDAIAAGVDPMALVESINEAQGDRAAAKGALAAAGEPAGITDAEVYAMIDSLGDIGAALADSEPGKLARLYRDLRLDLRYDNEKEAVYATTSLRVNNAG